MALLFAKIMGKSADNLVPDTTISAGSTTRPVNCELNTEETQALIKENGRALGQDRSNLSDTFWDAFNLKLGGEHGGRAQERNSLEKCFITPDDI